MNLPHLAGLACLTCSLTAWADGGAMLLTHDLTLRSAEPAITDFRVDGMYTLYETIRNESGQTWHGLRVEIIQHTSDGQTLPLMSASGASFMANEPVAAWRPSVEVRIDDHYLGLPGGGWQLKRNPTATALEINFDEMPPHHGQHVKLRLRVVNMNDTTWRLRYTPLPVPDTGQANYAPRHASLADERGVKPRIGP